MGQIDQHPSVARHRLTDCCQQPQPPPPHSRQESQQQSTRIWEGAWLILSLSFSLPNSLSRECGTRAAHVCNCLFLTSGAHMTTVVLYPVPAAACWRWCNHQGSVRYDLMMAMCWWSVSQDETAVYRVWWPSSMMRRRRGKVELGNDDAQRQKQQLTCSTHFMIFSTIDCHKPQNVFFSLSFGVYNLLSVIDGSGNYHPCPVVAMPNWSMSSTVDDDGERQLESLSVQ